MSQLEFLLTEGEVMQKGQKVPLIEVSNSFKEFLLLFFGAAWSQ
jgi:hypothetical protein